MFPLSTVETYLRRRREQQLLMLFIAVVGALLFHHSLTIIAYADGPNLKNGWSPSLTRDGSTAVVWGDIDNDGDLDLVVGGHHSYDDENDDAVDGIQLYLNQNGTLPTQPTQSFGPFNEGDFDIEGLALGDMDGDGKLDLAAAIVPEFEDLDIYVSGGQNKVFRNVGGRFQTTPVWTDTFTDTSRSVAWGDVNGDGKFDLAVGNDGTPNKIFRNDGFDGGNLQLTLIWTDTLTDHTRSVAWSDVNGDGNLDLAVGNGRDICYPNGPESVTRCNQGELNKIYLNIGQTLETTASWVSTEADFTASVAWGDWDNSGQPDLAVGNWPISLLGSSSGGENRVYKNLGTSLETTASWTSTLQNPTDSITWGDVDGDGDLDLAIGDYGASNKIYLNQGGLGLSVMPDWQSAATLASTSVAWGDIDGDLDLDLAVANDEQVNSLYINQSLRLTTDVITNPSLWGSTMAWGDVDNDGDLDLATDSIEGLKIYSNDRLFDDLLWTAWQPASLNGVIRSVAWGDMDGDGYLDLAVGIQQGQNKVYRNTQNGTLETSPIWTSTDSTDTTSVAWGDIDGDGDLDLAVGNELDGVKIYFNNSGILASTAAWHSEEREDRIASVAWGDVDGDGDLDLAVGNASGPNRVYVNTDGKLEETASWVSEDNRGTNVVVWGDVNGDGKLDLAAGNFSTPDVIYYNIDGQLQKTPGWTSQARVGTYSIAWGDADGDGDLDLASGGEDNIQVYVNHNGVLHAEASWSLNQDTSAVAWVDFDTNGTLDLARMHFHKPTFSIHKNGLPVDAHYPHLKPASLKIDLYSDPVATFNGTTTALAPANLYAVPGIRESGVVPLSYTIFTPSGEPMRAVRAFYSVDGGDNWLSAKPTGNTITRNLTIGTHIYEWDVFNSDFFGQSDNIVVRLEAFPALTPTLSGVPGPYQISHITDQTYPFRVRGNQVRVLYNEAHPDDKAAQEALVYHLPQNMQTGGLPFRDNDGKAFLTNSEGYLPGRGNLSIGDQLIALYPVSDIESSTNVCIPKTYTSNDVPQTIVEDGIVSVTSNLLIDDQGIISDVNVLGLAGTHTYIGDLAIWLRSPDNTEILLMDLGINCSDQDNFDVNLDDEAEGSPGDWPCAPIGRQTYKPNQPLANFVGEDISGEWILTIEDRFALDGGVLNGWALQICSLPPQKWRLFYTNATPITTGVTATTVIAPGIQVITVTDQRPLILFDLDISLEWDARKEPVFLDQLNFDLYRAAELLYDATNGQATLGQLTIYHDKENWNNADIRIHARNNLIPNADIGGLSSVNVVEVIEENPYAVSGQTVPYTITYRSSGAVRVGTQWNQFGEETGAQGEDWPRALVHELGHYLLYLHDNYLGLDDEGNIITIDQCNDTLMKNPYRFTEFRNNVNWGIECGQTISARRSGRSDWETITTFYAALSAPTMPLIGPVIVPLEITQIDFKEPTVAPMTLDAPLFELTDRNGGAFLVGDQAQAILYKVQEGLPVRLIDLGQPTLDLLLTRGASFGDRLCVYDLSDQPARIGCEMIEVNDTQLAVVEKPDWQPEIVVTPVNSSTFTILVTITEPVTQDLKARLYPGSGLATPAQTLSLSGQGYITTFNLDTAATDGFIQVWVDEVGTETNPRRESVTSYALGGSPEECTVTSDNYPQCLNNRIAMNKSTKQATQNFTPAISPDGKVLLYANTAFLDGEFYAIQKATKLPPIPEWATVVGDGYRLLASPGAPPFDQAVINFRYRGQDVPPGEESFLSLYYWHSDNKYWEKLNTTRNTVYNEVATGSQGAGLYALMSTLEIPLYQPGWNLVAYPVQETRPVSQALASIDEYYATVYGRDSTDGQDPWQVFSRQDDQGQRVPTWVNDLETLTFGQGYWINITEAVTLSLQGASEKALQSVPSPPATYYGTISATVGMMLTAYINETLCGSTTTQMQWLDGQMQTVYVVDVESSDTAGCGVPGQSIQFRLGGTVISPPIAWQNDRVQRLNLGSSPSAASIYLPVIFHQPVRTGPDLVVTQFTLTPTSPDENDPVRIAVTIQNQGTESAGSFWIDLYVNPDPVPSQANQVWSSLCTNPCYGLVWGVFDGLEPGQAITLSGTELITEQSVWPGTLPAGLHDLYIYVDSWHPDETTGAVSETNESNNRADQLKVSVRGTAVLKQERAPVPLLPKRSLP